MRISLRFVVPLIIAMALVAYGVVPLVDRLTLRWFVRDLDIRSEFVANTIAEPLTLQLASQARGKVVNYFNHITRDERLYAIAYCPGLQGPLLATALLPAEIQCDQLSRWTAPDSHVLSSAQGPLHVAV